MRISLLFLIACGSPNIDLEQSELAPTANEALTTSRSKVLSGELFELSLAPEGSATRSVVWSQKSPNTPAVAFSSTTDYITFLQAPLVTTLTTFTFTAAVTDKGQTTTSDITIEVAPTAAASALRINASRLSVVAGRGVLLSVQGGDDAVPTWQDGSTEEKRLWHAPAVAADTTFNLSVRRGAQTASIAIAVTVPRYAQDVAPLWSRCTGCHVAGSPASAGFDLTQTSELFATATRNNCGEGKRVVAGNPAASILIKRIAGLCPAPAKRMPANAVGYFDAHGDERVVLESWILAGARTE